LAFSRVPLASTLKAYSLATNAHSLVLAAARFLDHVFAVWARAPLLTLVLSNFQVFLYCLVFALDFL